jgi:hypothetical protein
MREHGRSRRWAPRYWGSWEISLSLQGGSEGADANSEHAWNDMFLYPICQVKNSVSENYFSDEIGIEWRDRRRIRCNSEIISFAEFRCAPDAISEHGRNDMLLYPFCQA